MDDMKSSKFLNGALGNPLEQMELLKVSAYFKIRCVDLFCVFDYNFLILIQPDIYKCNLHCLNQWDALIVNRLLLCTFEWASSLHKGLKAWQHLIILIDETQHLSHIEFLSRRLFLLWFLPGSVLGLCRHCITWSIHNRTCTPRHR